MTESFQSHVEETNELSDALALLCYVDFFNVFKNFIYLIINVDDQTQMFGFN